MNWRVSEFQDGRLVDQSSFEADDAARLHAIRIPPMVGRKVVLERWNGADRLVVSHDR
jgi:hypothetical protein